MSLLSKKYRSFRKYLSSYSLISIGMEITRSYTVALASLQVDPCEREWDGRRFFLMIKIYPEGTVTPSLQSLVSGE